MNAESSTLDRISGRARNLGIFTVILGLLAMAMPWVAGQTVLWMIAILMIIAGSNRMWWAMSTRSLGKGILAFLIGLLTLFAGIAMFTHPVMASGVLTIVVAAYLLADGLVELAAAAGMPAGTQGKGWLFFDAIVTIVLAVLIYQQFPLSGVLAMGILLGIKLVFIGMSMFLLGKAGKKLSRS